MNLHETICFRRLVWVSAFLALAACSPTLTDGPTVQATADAVATDAIPPDVAAQTDAAPSETAQAAPLGQFSPALVDFGPVDFGKCVVKTVSLSNWGTAALTVQGLDLAGLDAQFTVEWLSPAVLAGQGKPGGESWLLAAPLVLQAYQSAGLSLRFCPTKAGPVTAKVPVLSDGGPVALEVRATGVQANVPCYSLAGLTDVKFGDVVVGKAGKNSILLKNCGTMDLVLTKLQLIKDGADLPVEFAVDWSAAAASGMVGPGPISAANPMTVGVGASVLFELSYSPADATPQGQLDTAKLTFGFGHGPQEQTTLSGRGIEGCPVAVIKVAEGNMVVPQVNLHLLGTSSYSPVGAAIKKYQWTVKQPAGSNQPLLPTATFPSTMLQANAAGEYKFCLEVWDEFGEKSCKPSCTQVLVVPEAAIHIELLWDTPADKDQTDSGPAAGADLDLHFAHPLASGLDIDCDGIGDPWLSKPWDAFWFNPNPTWGSADIADDPSLDLDDTDGAGPENLNVETPEGTMAEPTAYAIGVHYWNDTGYGPSYAMVRVFVSGSLVAEVASGKLNPLDMWYVGKLHWPNTLNGGTKPPLETCFQSGYSCPAAKNLMWQTEGASCVTPCYLDKAFVALVGGAAAATCTPGFP